MTGFLDLFFWTVLTIGLTVGPFIDIVLGKPGQKRVRNWLETNWLRFNEVRWRNFGKKEAEYVVRVIDSVAGSRLLSWRRVAFATAALLIAFGSVVTQLSLYDPNAPFTGMSAAPPVSYVLAMPGLWAAAVSAAGIMMLSVSLTRAISMQVAKWCAPDSTMRNLSLFVGMLLVHVALLLFWGPFVERIGHFSTVLIGAILELLPWDAQWSLWTDLLSVEWSDLAPPFDRGLRKIEHILEIGLWPWLCNRLSLAYFASEFGAMAAAMRTDDVVQIICVETLRSTMEVIANGPRILVALVFLASFLLRPILQAPISLVWARIVESDRPIAIMVIGGAAAAVKLIQEIVKYVGDSGGLKDAI
jgi:hypothetical protein